MLLISGVYYSALGTLFDQFQCQKLSRDDHFRLKGEITTQTCVILAGQLNYSRNDPSLHSKLKRWNANHEKFFKWKSCLLIHKWPTDVFHLFSENENKKSIVHKCAFPRNGLTNVQDAFPSYFSDHWFPKQFWKAIKKLLLLLFVRICYEISSSWESLERFSAYRSLSLFQILQLRKNTQEKVWMKFTPSTQSL